MIKDIQNFLYNYVQHMRSILFKRSDIHSVMNMWAKHATIHGEDALVPDDFSESEKDKEILLKHLLAGGIAGAVSRTCTAPLDRIKLFFQVHSQHEQQTLAGCYNYMVKEGGYFSLWRGNGINVIKITPETALKFAAYEEIKVFLLNRHDEGSQLGVGERFLAGASAGAMAQLAIYPIEVTKTRLALRKTGEFEGIIHAVTVIYKKEGLRSFYRGFAPNVCGIIPYAGVDLTLYELLKKYALEHYSQERYDENETHPLFYGSIILMCGVFSSSVGQLTSYPFALVRTRLQAQSVVRLRSSGSMTGEFKTILERDGFLGLYRGLLPTCLKVIPAVSISYLVYEFFRHLLGITMT